MKEEAIKKQTYKQLKNKEALYSAALGLIFALTLITIGTGIFLYVNGLNGLYLILAGSFGLLLFPMTYKGLKKVQGEIQIREIEEPNLVENKLKNLSIEELQKKSKLQSGLIGAFIGVIVAFVVVDILIYIYSDELNFATSMGIFSFLFFIPLLLKEKKAVKQELNRRNT